MINKIKYIKENKTVYEFFRDFTLNAFDIDPIVKKYFDFKFNRFSMYTISIMDIMICNNILRLKKEDYDYVIIYAGSTHSRNYIEFICKNNLLDKNYSIVDDEIVIKGLKSMNLIN